MTAKKTNSKPRLPKGLSRTALESMIESHFSSMCNEIGCDNTSPCVACALGVAEE
ncbi:unnamed protein product, partial [marine sediment metagenome]